MRRQIGLVVLFLVLSLCALPGSVAAQPGGHAKGTLRVVTYNIAGLPEGISRSRPRVNIPLMAPFLADYDIALLQEDFAYQSLLRAHASHRHVSSAHPGRFRFDFGDGLSRLSHTPFSAPVRQAWSRCHGYLDSGSDCLAPKGFSLSRHELAPGVDVDVYNFHMDAGWSANDSEARRAQVEQLVQAIAELSQGRALIVGGDTNMFGGDSRLLRELERGAGLRDSCRVLDCAEPNRIDRILYRSSSTLRLRPTTWGVDRRFVDAQGRALSDHLAVGVTFVWDTQAPAMRAFP